MVRVVDATGLLGRAVVRCHWFVERDGNFFATVDGRGDNCALHFGSATGFFGWVVAGLDVGVKRKFVWWRGVELAYRYSYGHSALLLAAE